MKRVPAENLDEPELKLAFINAPPGRRWLGEIFA